MLGIVVQKFGGTSLADASRRQQAVRHIENRLREGYAPVVVVSAIGRKGDPYATDTLLDLGNSSGTPLADREHDLIASCGEVISAVVMAQMLIAAGIPAVPLNGRQAGIVTDGVYSRSRVLQIDTARLRSLIETGQVPVIAGFQGGWQDAEITTLGRGGSDTSACIVGAALGAIQVEIYTDVEGIMTADPRIVENAQLIQQADYQEIRALAQNGSKVIMDQGLEVAASAGIPVVVKSNAISSVGTRVHFRRPSAPVTGVTSFSRITFFRLKANQGNSYASDLHAFRIIADAGISVNFIDVRPQETTFVVDSQWSHEVDCLLRESSFEYEAENDYVKVSVVGMGMTGQPGMMATIVDALAKQNIRIYQSTDSQTSISCLVRSEDEDEAVRSLHDAFHLGDEHS